MRLRASISGLLVLFGSGCREAPKVPEPPDMSALVADYDAPAGELNTTTGPAVVQDFASKYEQILVAAELAGVVGSQIGNFGGLAGGDPGQAQSGLGSTEQGLSAEIDYWADFTYVCVGWPSEGANPDLVDREWGVIEFKNVFDSLTAPGKITWGEADGCRMETSQGDRQDFNGDIRALVDAGIVLFAYDGTWFDKTAKPMDVVIDGRFGGETIELRSVQPTGSIVAALDLADLGAIASALGCSGPSCPGFPLVMRDRKGSWTCSLDASLKGRCTITDAGGGEEEEVSW